ncbi:MAG: hypothetical protein LiPW30_8 [Parcubacteria group bacterium LiPW_30]|nr:MAG: hypothetical protein LiPW30_8 [Parcubacteria group bacterium LiPW_30]
MGIHLTLLKPGPGHACPEDDVLVELSNRDSVEADRAYWAEVGESSNIVVGHVLLDVPEEVVDYMDSLMERGEPELLEQLLTVTFNLGRAYQQ